MYKLNYDGNENETYSLMFNQIPQAELLLGEDGAMEITDCINHFIQSNIINENDIIEVKNDDDKLGIIVDIWDEEQSNCYTTCCFWFDDFRE